VAFVFNEAGLKRTHLHKCEPRFRRSGLTIYSASERG